ncbi:MAG: NTP transferase domain-containing protein [Chloroflexi bacterium]|nr:NTP transferase domain-containing protein [Anaerolineaceae bacterium]NMB91160.1 NTP transferase domain-containing protein [Chloroflexota bacterium]
MKGTAVILAAGHGVRMRSALPKVLHPLVGVPLIRYPLKAVGEATGETPVVVVGHGADAVRYELGDEARFAVQEQQLGTAHAVLSAEAQLAGRGDLVLVTSADLPLLTTATFRRLLAAQAENTGPLTMVTIISPDPRGFGRILRAEDGSVTAIIEEAQATPEQRAIRELNVGAYCFRSDWLWPALRRVKISPKGEYYLTDLIGLAVGDGQYVQALTLEDPSESIGINNRLHLSEAEAALRRRINEAWMLAGVTLIDPRATYIEAGVKIGEDTTIYPGTHLRGHTEIGKGCHIGPNTILEDARVGAGCTILSSVVEKTTLDDNIKIGPFAHIREDVVQTVPIH